MLLCEPPPPTLLLVDIPEDGPGPCQKFTNAPPPVAALPAGIGWLCAGISAVVRVCVSKPPVAPSARAVRPDPVPTPISARPRPSGRLNVVDPFPAPNVVPIAANRAA